NEDRNRLGSVHPSKGKFRSFLLACLKNYVRNEWDKGQAKKRIPVEKQIHIPISDEETIYWEPEGKEEDPAIAFERNWASRLIAHVLKEFEAKYKENGKVLEFQVLSPFIVGEAEHGEYEEAAKKLGKEQGAVRTAATRLRKEFRAHLREEVGRTLSDP